MKPSSCFSIVVLVLLAAAGCGSPVTGDDLVPPRPLGAGLAIASDEVPTTRRESAEPLTLRAALELALMHSPDLAGVSWDIRAAEARRLQAGLLPNPELEIEVENFAGTGEFGGLRSAETTVQLGQLIELGDKRAKRLAVADRQRDLAAWDFEAMRLTVYARTAKAFVNVVAAQRKLTLAGELAQLSGQVFDAAAERVKAGKSPPLEQSKAKVERATRQLELERARQELAAARQSLAATWGSTSPRFTDAQGTLDPPDAIPSPQQLRELLVRNPDVARWTAEMGRRQAALAVERSKGVPDLTVRIGAKRFEQGDDLALVAGLSLPLPVFDRNQGAIRESLAGVAQADAQRRSAEAQAHVDLAEAYQLLASAFAEATVLRRDVLPAAQEAFDVASEGYRQGKFAYLEVLDAQRTLFEARSRAIDSLAALHRAAADVERLVGQDLKSITTTK